jgi:hypothetical protein
MGLSGYDCLKSPEVQESPKKEIPFEIKFEYEMNRTDINILDNIENLTLEGIKLFKPKPGPKNKKFSLFRKKFT